MVLEEGRIVLSMAAIRFLSAAIECTAAFLMLRSAKVQSAFQINAVLALIGPLVLLSVSALGLLGLAGKIPPAKVGLIALGVGLILWGARSS